MYYYKNGRLKQVKGGFVVEFEKSVKSKDSYDGLSYIGSSMEIFDNGEEALEKLNEIYMSEHKMEKVKMMKKKSKEMEEDDDD